MHIQEVSFDAHIQRRKWQCGKQSKIALYQQRARLHYEPVNRMGAQHCQTALRQASDASAGWYGSVAEAIIPGSAGAAGLRIPAPAPRRLFTFCRTQVPQAAAQTALQGSPGHTKRTADPAKGTSRIWVERMGKARGQEATFLVGSKRA